MSKTRKSTIEILGTWKSVSNPNFSYGEFATIKSFKPLEFDGFKKQANIKRLNEIAIRQMQVLTLTTAPALKQIKE